jgi:PDZ domain-containing secreted protein
MELETIELSEKYSHLQRVYETCKLQQQEAETRNNILSGQLSMEEDNSNKLMACLSKNKTTIGGLNNINNILTAKLFALKIEYDCMVDKFEERASYGRSMDAKLIAYMEDDARLIAYREDNARLKIDIKNKDKDFKNFKIVFDQLGKNNDDLRLRLKKSTDLSYYHKSIPLFVFALLATSVLHLRLLLPFHQR